MSAAIALLAGLGAGYLNEDRRKSDEDKADRRYETEQARLKVRDQREAENHDYLMGERALATSDRTALRVAAAPVPVVPENGIKPDTMDNVDVGQPGEAPVAPVFRVGANTFASRGVADQAASSTQRSNVAAALAVQDPVRADQYRATGMQADAAETQLREAARKAINEGTLDAMGAAIAGRSSDEVREAFNRTGKTKVAELTVEPFEFMHPTLGKQRSARIVGKMEDGTPINVPDAFEASLNLFGAAKRFDLLGQWRESERKSEHDKGMLKIAQQGADTQAGYRRDQAAHFRAMEGAAAAKGSQPAQVTLKDKRDFESDLAGYLKDQFPVKEGADPTERAAINAQATARKAAGQTMFHTNAQLGMPLTAATVLQAMELASDRKNVRVINAGGVAYEGVIVNGQPVITSAPLRRREQAGPVAAPGATPLPGQSVIDPAIRAAAPGSWERPTPAAMAAQGVQPAPAQPGARQQAASGLPPEHAAVLDPMSQQIATMAQALAAAAQSGDQAAIAAYAKQLETAKAARNNEAVRRLGPNVAQQYIDSLPA